MAKPVTGCNPARSLLRLVRSRGGGASTRKSEVHKDLGGVPPAAPTQVHIAVLDERVAEDQTILSCRANSSASRTGSSPRKAPLALGLVTL